MGYNRRSRVGSSGLNSQRKSVHGSSFAVSKLRKHLILLVAGAISALLLVQYLRILAPAQARAIEAACNGMRPAPENPVFGDLDQPPLARDFEAQDHTGRMVKLSDYRGKVVVLNFFASWCNVCKSEKPSLEAFRDDFSPEDVAVLALASDESWEPVKKALPDGSPLQVLLDPPADGGNLGAIAKSYGITAVPETFVIDREGRIRHYFINKRDWDSAVAHTCVRALVNE